MMYRGSGARSLILLLAGSLSFVGTSCAGDGLDDAKGNLPSGPVSPQPPPPGTLSFDFDLAAVETAFSGSNHRQAMAHVQALSVSIGDRLLMAQEILSHVGRTSPVMTRQDTWVWSYAVSGQNRSWTTNLTGQSLSDSVVKWQARVATTPIDSYGCCSDVLFLEGESFNTGSGNWQVFDLSKIAKPEKLLSMTYGYENDAMRTLQLTVNSQRTLGERFGANSVVKYQVSGDQADVQIRDSSEGATRNISWNRATKAGSHTDLQGNRVCWLA